MATPFRWLPRSPTCSNIAADQSPTRQPRHARSVEHPVAQLSSTQRPPSRWRRAAPCARRSLAPTASSTPQHVARWIRSTWMESLAVAMSPVGRPGQPTNDQPITRSSSMRVMPFDPGTHDRFLRASIDTSAPVRRGTPLCRGGSHCAGPPNRLPNWSHLTLTPLALR
jgi:hypothetical protein